MFVPLHKGKGKRTECVNCRCISWRNISRSISRVTEGFIDREQAIFGSGKGVMIKSLL